MTNLILRFDPSRVNLPHNIEMFIEVEKMARSIQKLETVTSVLIGAFMSEENIIYPLIGHLDECTRIIEKYIRLNVVYKLVYGCNFLSKLKIVYARIDNLMGTSRIDLKSNVELTAEFKRVYPELVYLLFDSFLVSKVRAQVDSSGASVTTRSTTSAQKSHHRGETVESLVEQALNSSQYDSHRF